jgi:hypothetical protein
MPRGGAREGAGGLSTWKHGKTKTIRVPEVLAEKVLAIARLLDANPLSYEPVTGSNIAVTGSNVIDLSGVQVTQVNGEIAVKLEDLVGIGFALQPRSLAEMVDARIRRKRRR